MAKQLIRLLCLLLFCNYSLAETSYGSLFYVDASDASLSVLGQMFGTVGTVLTGNSIIIAKMFNYFNNGILLFTTVLLTYTMFTTVIDTANDGKALGNKFNYFTVIRSGAGLASLIPLVNGYCAVQVVIMWVIIQGIGFANYLWTQSVVMISTNGSFNSASMQNTYGSDAENATTIEGLAMGNSDPNKSYSTNAGVPVVVLLRSALCTQTVYNYDVSAAAINKTLKPMSDDYGYFIQNDHSLCFGTRFVDASGSASYNCQCGEYQVPYDCASGTTAAVSSNNSDHSTDLYMSNSTNIVTIAATVMSFAKNIYTTLEDNNASSICDAYGGSGTDINCNSATNVISIANLYGQYVEAYQLSQTSNAPLSSTCPDWVQNASSEGWMLAVSHYYDMTSTSTACSSVTLYNYSCMMPYSTAGISDNNIISNSNSKPCMTSNSGYSGDLCNNLDSTATTTWTNSGDLLTLIYTYKDMIPYLYNTTASDVSSGDSAFSNYYDAMLKKYLDVFIRTNYTPGELATDLTNFGNQRPVVNGMMALINQVVGKVLGLNPYNSTKPSDIFASNIISSSLPSPSSACKACTSLTNCGGCLNTEGWGLLGAIYAENYPSTGATQMDPISSLQLVGKDALLYSLGYITHTINTVFTNLRDTASTAAGVMVGVAGAWGVIASLTQMFTGMMAVFGFTAMNIFITILVTIHKTLLMAWLPVAATATVIFMTIGIILCIYIPFLPFVLFFSGVISWVIAVVEAMVAAPMIAMGVTHPKGSDFLGKAEQSAMLLLAVFIRPAAIIIGFISAISLSYVAMRLLNISFSVIFIQAFDAIGGNSTGSMVLGGTSIMIIYTYCCIAILSQTFSLIYQIPDKVMRWIGMPQDQTSGSAMEMARGMKSGVSDMASGASGAASDSAKSSGVGDYKVQGLYARMNEGSSRVAESTGGVDDSRDETDGISDMADHTSTGAAAETPEQLQAEAHAEDDLELTEGAEAVAARVQRHSEGPDGETPDGDER
jgi:hypothetical protein